MIRRIQRSDTDLLKQLRLMSLRDAPYAFSTTYDSALQRSDEAWRERVESTAQGTNQATFIAFADDMPVGMASLVRLEDQADVGELLQVWVAPEHRGTSTAWDLMNVIFEWAHENNFHRIIAGVTKVNARALKFYVKYGFSVIDRSAPNDADGVYLTKEVK